MDRFLIFSLTATIVAVICAFQALGMGRADNRVIAAKFAIAAAAFACLPVLRLLLRRFLGQSRSGPR